ncbi:MAG: flagellin lysine-N-methylase, partial [Candidatus Pristimantibacillus sp.]
QLKPMFQKYIIPRNQHNTDDLDDIAFAQIVMNHDRSCPFLSEDRLCNIQKTLGEKLLSITCDTYPRNYINVDSVLERSLSVSCPSAAELILLNEKPMQFDRIDTDVQLRNNQTPVLNTSLNENDKPYPFFRRYDPSLFLYCRIEPILYGNV